ncbi:hypothetical protein PILCRDRAFT_434026 [Piloderma croceum F 1598]|uniref:Uncharacterized protein n=1 Tax=Piloderma croceum (strain F 1598) TaxID=765440 RepID=A0A0C3FH76_PILCF|nr:hypothetical protein PILCRDRAFT_434026 [Piloderma croceum F 1598]
MRFRAQFLTVTKTFDSIPALIPDVSTMLIMFRFAKAWLKQAHHLAFVALFFWHCSNTPLLPNLSYFLHCLHKYPLSPGCHLFFRQLEKMKLRRRTGTSMSSPAAKLSCRKREKDCRSSERRRCRC